MKQQFEPVWIGKTLYLGGDWPELHQTNLGAHQLTDAEREALTAAGRDLQRAALVKATVAADSPLTELARLKAHVKGYSLRSLRADLAVLRAVERGTAKSSAPALLDIDNQEVIKRICK